MWVLVLSCSHINLVSMNHFSQALDVRLAAMGKESFERRQGISALRWHLKHTVGLKAPSYFNTVEAEGWLRHEARERFNNGERAPGSEPTL